MEVNGDLQLFGYQHFYSYIQQKKETHTGLEKLNDDQIFMMDGCTLLDFKISTAIHCHYEALGRDRTLYNIFPIVFVWKKNVIYT